MTDETRPADDRQARLRTSAEGWHRVQLAVLGFVGICGVLEKGAAGEAAAPGWIQALAGVLVLAALGVALLAIYLVGRVAWPVLAARRPPTPAYGTGTGDDEVAAAVRSLRAGQVATFAAVALLALAATAGWWPSGNAGGGEDTAAALVLVETTAGQVCGQLADSQDGVAVETDQGTVGIRPEAIVWLRPATSC